MDAVTPPPLPPIRAYGLTGYRRGGGLSWGGVLSWVGVLGWVAHMFWITGKIPELEVWF